MPAPRPNRTVNTYTPGVVVMAGAGRDNLERIPVLLGNADRIRAKRAMGVSHQKAIEAGDGEEWMARAVYSAWRRETGHDDDFEAWLERFVGVEYDDDELEEEADDEAPAGAAGSEEDDPGKAKRAE